MNQQAATDAKPAPAQNPSALIATPASHSVALDWRNAAKIFIAIACTFLTFLNIGAITAATPDLSGTFVVGVLDVSWAGAACPMGMVMAFSFATYLWSRIGLKRSMRVSLLMMFVGSILGLAADHFLLMIASRFLQGAGGGLSLVLGTGILIEARPREKIKFWSIIKVSCIGLGSCASPIAGCLLVEYWHWRGLFAIVAVASLFLAALNEWAVTNQTIPKQGKFDWASFLFLFFCCACILMVILNGETDGWTSFSVMVWMYLGICSFILTFISCLSHKTPLLDMKHFLNWRFSLGLLAALCNLFCVCWIRSAIVQFMRNVLGYDPMQIAYVFVWSVLAFMVFIAVLLPLIMRDKVAPRVVMMLGMTSLAGCAFFLARLDTGSSSTSIILALMLFGCGYALCLLSATDLVLRAVSPRHVSSANRLLNSIRNISVAMIISAVSTVLAHTTTNYHFSIAEHTHENRPGVKQTMTEWNEYFQQAGASEIEAQSETKAMLVRAVSLQSQVFSMNYLFIIALLVGAGGTVVSLFCLRPNANKQIFT